MQAGEFSDDYDDWLEAPKEPPKHLFDRVLGDMPRSRLTSVRASASVSEASVLMARDHHGAVMVLDEGKLIGIFTERDLLERVIGRGKDPHTTFVRDAMTRGPVVLSESALLSQAIREMVMGDYRHVPIVDEFGHAVSMISMRDVLNYVSEACANEVWTSPSKRPSYPPIPDGA